MQGLCYAMTDDGLELPVIDITHPAFAEAPGAPELEAMRRRYWRELNVRARLPAFLRGLVAGWYARRSTLVRMALAQGARAGVMSGTATYLMKLGPANLGDAYATPLDRKLAATWPPYSLRMRLRMIAQLVADAIPDRGPLELINIGGGPAMDSLNALLLVGKERLAGRRVAIHVLDGDAAGPAFGARALAALRQGPLAGLDVTLAHEPYDWCDVAPLRALLAGLAADATVIASSEGALFDYGSDEEIAANLRALAGRAETVVGSLVPDNAMARLGQRETRLSYRIRGLEPFRALARGAGWTLVKSVDGAGGHGIQLRPT